MAKKEKYTAPLANTQELGRATTPTNSNVSSIIQFDINDILNALTDKNDKDNIYSTVIGLREIGEFQTKTLLTINKLLVDHLPKITDIFSILSTGKYTIWDEQTQQAIQQDAAGLAAGYAGLESNINKLSSAISGFNSNAFSQLSTAITDLNNNLNTNFNSKVVGSNPQIELSKDFKDQIDELKKALSDGLIIGMDPKNPLEVNFDFGSADENSVALIQELTKFAKALGTSVNGKNLNMDFGQFLDAISNFNIMIEYINQMEIAEITNDNVNNLVVIGEIIDAINKSYEMVDTKNIIRSSIITPLFIDLIKQLYSADAEDKSIIVLMNNLIDYIINKDIVDKSKILYKLDRAVSDLGDVVDSILAMSSPMKYTALKFSNKFFNRLVSVINNFIDSLDKINPIDSDKLNDVIKITNNLSKIILVSTGVLFAAVVAGGVVTTSLPAILAFTSGVTLLTTGLILAIGTANKLFNSVFTDYNADTPEDIMKPYLSLIATSSLIMMAASLVVKKVDPVSLTVFTALLSGFLFSLILVVNAANLASRALAAYIDRKNNNRKNSRILGDTGDVTGTPLDGLYKLVIASATVLIIGGVIMSQNQEFIKNSFKFANLLSEFLFAVIVPYALVGALAPIAMASADKMQKLIVTSSIILVLGALWMTTGMWTQALAFAGILGVFILAVTVAFTLPAKLAPMAMQAAAKMAILVATAASIVLIASLVNVKYGRILIFTLSMMTLVAGMTGIIAGVNAIFKTINPITAMLIIGAITVLIELMALAIGSVTLVTKLVADGPGWNNIFITLGAMAAFIVTFGGFAIALGAIISTGAGALILGAGIATLIAIVYTIRYMATTIKAISDAVLSTREINIDKDFKQIEDIFTKIAGLFTTIEQKTKDIDIFDFARIRRALRTTKLLAAAVSQVGNAIHDFANLTMHNYDATGRILPGKRVMTTAEIKKAAENIGIVITTIGGALVKTYGENKSWFEADNIKIGDGLLSLSIPGTAKMTPFYRVVTASASMGVLIKNIAEGILAYSKMDFGGNTKMTAKLFTDAGNNISTVISTIGAALMDTFKEHKSWFEDETLLGKIGLAKAQNADKRTAFGKIIMASSGMAKVIKDISDAINQYANYKFGDGDAVTGDDIFTKAKENIVKVLTGMFDAVNMAYQSGDEKIYEDARTGWFGWKHVEGTSPIAKMVAAASGIADILKNMLEVYDKYNSDELADKITKSQGNITDILTTIIKAYSDAINNKEVKTILGNNKKAGLETSEFINNIVSSVNSIISAFASIDDENLKESVFDDTAIGGITKLMEAFSKMPIIPPALADGATASAQIIAGYAENLTAVKEMIITVGDTSKLTDVSDFVGKLYEQLSLKEYTADNKKTKDFGQRVKDTKEFVKTVNSMDVNKIDSISRFAEAINNLAEHTGDIKSLTDTLNGTFVQTVSTLSSNVASAKQTIKMADDLQEKRKTTIKESIKQMETIMNKPMLVKVNNETGSATTESDGGSVATDSETNNSQQISPAALQKAFENALKSQVVKVTKI